MGLNLGNLIGAASSLQSGFGGSSSLKDFLTSMDNLGVQITSRYEATFSAIPQTTFFIESINTPGFKQNTTTLYFDGRAVEMPQNYEYEHDFTMTVINDSSGFIYSTLINFIANDTGSALASSGYTITIKAIGDDNHSGCSYKFNGVRIKGVGGLSFNHIGGDVQKFDLQCYAQNFEVSPGGMAKITGVTGAIGSLLG